MSRGEVQLGEHIHMDEQEHEPMDYDGIIAQLQGENEKLREQLTHAMKNTPITEAIDGMVLVIKQSDPMKLYMYCLCGFLLVMAIARLLEVFIP
jgi:hypothetical protein